MASQEELDREKDLLRLIQQRVGIQEDILEDVRDIGNVISDQLKNLKFERSERTEIRSLVREINKSATENYNTTLKELGSQRQLTKIQKDRVNLDKQLLSLQNLLEKFSKGRTQREQDLAFALGEQIVSTQNLIGNLAQIESQSKAIAQNFSVKTFEGLSRIVKDIPVLRQFSAPFEKAADASRIVTAENTRLDDLLQKRAKVFDISNKSGKGVTREKIKELGLEKELGQSYGLNAIKKANELGLHEKIEGKQNAAIAGAKELNTVVNKLAWAAILKSIGEINAQQVELQRNLGKSVQSLDLIDGGYGTQVDQLKSINALTEQFGFNTMAAFDAVNLREVTELTKAFGLASEEAGQLAFYAQSNGENLRDVTDQAYKNISPLLSQRQILKEISKVSPSIAMSFGGSAEKLATAASNARLLGLNLSQVDKIADGLLDIERSLTAEFEAEVITGKQLNLERARFFALTNDIEGVTREIANNQEVLNSFSSGTRIEQQAIADSLGLSRDEISKMIFNQKIIEEMSIEEAARQSGMSIEDAKRLSIQQNLNDSISKMAEVLAGPAELVADILSNFRFIIPLVLGITAALKAMAATEAILIGFQTIKNGLKKKELQTEAAITTVKSISNPAIAIAGLAVGAIVAGVTAGYMMKGNDVFSEGGYGSRTLMGPEGAIALNNKDTVIAGTNLFPQPEKGLEIRGLDKLLSTLSIQPSKQLELNQSSSPIQPLGREIEPSLPTTTPFPERGIERNSPTATSVAIDYDKLADAIAMGAERGTSKANLNVNLDGNRVSNTLQTPMAVNARRYSV